jgi:tripeptidyl-peptidase-1
MPACDAYHVPKNIRRHIDYITPGIKLMAPVQSLREKKRAVVTRDLAKRSTAARVLSKGVPPPPTIDHTGTSQCDLAITPACVAALYKIPPSHLKHPNNSLGIFESELQFYTQEDLDIFFTNYTTPHHIPNGTHPIAANVDGGQGATEDPYQAGAEASLDLQLAYPIVYPQALTLYNVDDFIVQANQNDTYTFGFNTWLDAIDGVSLISP